MDKLFRLITPRIFFFYVTRFSAPRFFCAAVLFLFSAFANAATVLPLSLSELVDAADTIVVAKCLDKKTRWENNKIITDVRLEIDASVKGDPSTSFTVSILGGTAIHPVLQSEVKMNVSGAADFVLGEESIVFTRKSKSGKNQIVGMTQGKFDIRYDEASGNDVIRVGQKRLALDDGMDESWSYFSVDAVFHGDDITLVQKSMSVQEFLQKITSELGE